ncbi:MAG TPA: glycosyltransferase family 4 protein [Candidatus Sulfotelmatobacter sp.]|nr:glycosyltransferase family 4 protein [Candidatus Sulfotelmatobacter sp.]
MLTVAFLANEFPSPLERYVTDQIEELKKRNMHVIAGSVRRPKGHAGPMPEVVVQGFEANALGRAAWLLIRRWRHIAPLLRRIAFQGNEGFWQRVKAVAHTLLGACYAAKLEGRGVDHIHVHHGYFGSWIAMTASRLLGVPFSMTLYGSDLLLHGVYLDTKLQLCSLCLNVSEYNRQYTLEHYPEIVPQKLLLLRMGVGVPERSTPVIVNSSAADHPLILLAVGRLHPVKDHAFLVRACAGLRDRGVPFRCFIVGGGPEHAALEFLIRQCGLKEHVQLLGYVSEEQRDSLYDRADAVVLTSRSEGIPVVLMEAMARGKIVVAPAITGIPELVIPGKTGFLYEPGSIAGLVHCLMFIRSEMQDRGSTALECIRLGARVQVRQNFNRSKNTQLFADLLLQRIPTETEGVSHESFVLQ